MRLAVIDAGNVFNTAGTPVSDGSLSSISPDATAARSAWINIFRTQLPNIVSAPQMIPGLIGAGALCGCDKAQPSAGIEYRETRGVGHPLSVSVKIRPSS